MTGGQKKRLIGAQDFALLKNNPQANTDPWIKSLLQPIYIKKLNL